MATSGNAASTSSKSGRYGQHDDGIAGDTVDAKTDDVFRAIAEKHPR
jgi:hypothetical protein